MREPIGRRRMLKDAYSNLKCPHCGIPRRYKIRDLKTGKNLVFKTGNGELTEYKTGIKGNGRIYNRSIPEDMIKKRWRCINCKRTFITIMKLAEEDTVGAKVEIVKPVPARTEKKKEEVQPPQK